jgi:lipopolysaccharide export LptBFGC system permease protein LptF
MGLGDIIVGGGIFYYYYKKIKKAQFKNQIPLFMNTHGKLKRMGIDQAREMFIPDSNISLFYLKNKKIYTPRPTRAMGDNEYWYSIGENGEWVNFDLSVDPTKNTLALANYDHRDTRYAYVNVNEMIKRNYKDKSVKWWKEYSNLIFFVVMAFIFIMGCWVLIAKIMSAIEQLAPLVENMAKTAENMARIQNFNSGVVPA